MREVSKAPSALPPELDRSAMMRRFADAFRIRPWIYWTDMVGSAAAGWTLFYLSTQAPLGSIAHLAMTVGAILGLLRAALFIHELAHVKRAQIPGFDVVWNALVGVPVLVPGIMYSGSHMDHHRRNGFGTMEDPEYAPIAKWSRPRIALFVLTVAFAPLALVVRWAVLGPLSWLIPPLRKLVVERLSTLGINSHYRRALPEGTKKVRWIREETACALFVWSVAAGTALGWIPLAFVGQWFVVAAGVLVVNQVRTLAAHKGSSWTPSISPAGRSSPLSWRLWACATTPFTTTCPTCRTTAWAWCTVGCFRSCRPTRRTGARPATASWSPSRSSGTKRRHDFAGPASGEAAGSRTSLGFTSLRGLPPLLCGSRQRRSRWLPHFARLHLAARATALAKDLRSRGEPRGVGWLEWEVRSTHLRDGRINLPAGRIGRTVILYLDTSEVEPANERSA
jgi:hypothetical protein